MLFTVDSPPFVDRRTVVSDLLDQDPKPRTGDGQLIFYLRFCRYLTRIRASWTTETASSPERVNISPLASPRAAPDHGDSWAYSIQSSTRNGRWNHIAWSSDAPETLEAPHASPWVSSTVSTRVKSEA